MTKNRYLLGLALLVVGSMPLYSQVSDDNEDGVVKMNADRSRYDYVEGQVLVKFKDANRVQVQCARGRFNATNVSGLTTVLQKYGVEEMEQVLPNENPNRKMRRAKAYNGETIVEKDLSQLYQVKLSAEHSREVMPLIDELKSLPEVEFAEPNYYLHTLADDHIADSYSDNPMATQQWYLDSYGVKDLWNKPIINKERPVIAIIDTGVDLTHPDLKDNLWTNQKEAEGEANYDNDGNGFAGDVHGWDFINNTPNIRDNNMHGTHVAGIAAASNNSLGIVGANPLALIMAVSVMQSDGTGDVATIIKGIDYAILNGATVLNLSLGTYANSSALRQALEKAYQKAVIVAAAGNDGRCINTPHYPDPCKLVGPMFPAAYSFVLGVQATTSAGSLAAFSNYDDDGASFSCVTTLLDPDGFNYELQAPGTNMLSTIPGGKYKSLQGTSMAAPLVAGAISALKMVKQYDTQEILWGDLLHSNNIAGAYNITARPAELDMMKVQLQNRKDLEDETEEDYSGDHEIDAGEIVSIYPVIRTTFGEASNIKLKLAMGDEFEDASTVEIITGEADFGLHLDAYGRGVSVNPLVLKVANNVADARHIKMKVLATCDESPQTYELPFTMVVTNLVKINGLISDSMTLTADHTYLVNENLGIMEGATLTIEPGTRIEFMEGMGLSSFGKLIAKGTPEKPIVFTRHTGEGMWAGVWTHKSSGEHRHEACLYTNNDSTLFTLLPTEQTPNKMVNSGISVYYSNGEENPGKTFRMANYIDDWNPEDWCPDMTTKQALLTDPNYLTPSMLKMLSEYREYCKLYAQQQWSKEKFSGYIGIQFSDWSTFDNPRDTISYCIIDGYNSNAHGGNLAPYMKDCVVASASSWSQFYNFSAIRTNIAGLTDSFLGTYLDEGQLRYSNVINNISEWHADLLFSYNRLSGYNNVFNNYYRCTASGKYQGKEYSLAINSPQPCIDASSEPSYLGTGCEDVIRPYIYEIGNAPETYGQIDLSNMPTRPYTEAHGIVWKVVVNGKDAQDEYDQLPPLGVGKHKFEVYFNRPMNKNVAPQISFGVRDPWTQQAVAEDGSWNEEGTIYTAYKTIDGKTKSDGICRIYVHGAEDNEFFEIPYEKTRFNIQVQAAGSMATGFAAEAGLGRVSLTWDNTNNNFDDAMGFNIYRFGEPYEKQVYRPHVDENGQWQEYETIMAVDTVRINTDIVDIETTSYIDYDVTPGNTYYYIYKVLSTDLQEYDVSNVVAATPLTSSLGDANGDTKVDVSDVMTTVNYALGLDQKPFIFEAADVNTDKLINVLDVIGIVQMVLHPSAARVNASDGEVEVVYTVENGMLCIEMPVAIGGFQVQLALDRPHNITPTETLNGFEVASSWLTDTDCRLMAYSFGGKTLPAGKHTVLYIGDADMTSLCFSDTQGKELRSVAGDATAVDGLTVKRMMNTDGVFNLNGQKVAGSADAKALKHGVYIINGQKIVK